MINEPIPGADYFPPIPLSSLKVITSLGCMQVMVDVTY